MLQRQTSFREFGRLQSRTSPFKKQLSLRMSELPSSLERKSNDAAEFGSSNRKYMKEKSSYDVQKINTTARKLMILLQTTVCTH